MKIHKFAADCCVGLQLSAPLQWKGRGWPEKTLIQMKG